MYYTYFRCSTDTQMENNGFQMQKDVVKKYCEDNNIEVTDSFCDEGISGTVADRPGITDLLSVIQSGDKIIVQNTSRIWRDDFAKVMIRRQIQKVGADVISVEQPKYSVNVKDPNEFLINSMFELLDQYDRMSIAMKLSKGRKAKANKGTKACGTAPYGYRWENAKIVVDYNNDKIVYDIFLRYTVLGSLSKLKAYCDKMEYRTSQGKLFSKQSLSNMLKNDFYIGIVTHAGKKVKGTHPAIIDKPLFNDVQKILQNKILA